MRCAECGLGFGLFDPMIQIMQRKLNKENAVEVSGYAHAYHFKNLDEYS